MPYSLCGCQRGLSQDNPNVHVVWAFHLHAYCWHYRLPKYKQMREKMTNVVNCRKRDKAVSTISILPCGVIILHGLPDARIFQVVRLPSVWLAINCLPSCCHDTDLNAWNYTTLNQCFQGKLCSYKHTQGSYRQVWVKFKDFWRTSQSISNSFQRLKNNEKYWSKC